METVKNKPERLVMHPFLYWKRPGTLVPRSEEEKERTRREFGLAMDRVNRGDTAEVKPNLGKLVEIVCESPVEWGLANSLFLITDVSDRFKAAMEVISLAPAKVARRVMEESVEKNAWKGKWEVVRQFALTSSDRKKVSDAIHIAWMGGNSALLAEIAKDGKTTAIRQEAKFVSGSIPESFQVPHGTCR